MLAVQPGVGRSVTLQRRALLSTMAISRVSIQERTFSFVDVDPHPHQDLLEAMTKPFPF